MADEILQRKAYKPVADPDALKSQSRSRDMCEWEEFAESATRARDAMGQARSGQLSPFLLLSVTGINAREHRDCSELWTRDRVAASLAGAPPDGVSARAEYAAKTPYRLSVQ